MLSVLFALLSLTPCALAQGLVNFDGAEEAHWMIDYANRHFLEKEVFVQKLRDMREREEAKVNLAAFVFTEKSVRTLDRLLEIGILLKEPERAAAYARLLEADPIFMSRLEHMHRYYLQTGDKLGLTRIEQRQHAEELKTTTRAALPSII